MKPETVFVKRYGVGFKRSVFNKSITPHISMKISKGYGFTLSNKRTMDAIFFINPDNIGVITYNHSLKLVF